MIAATLGILCVRGRDVEAYGLSLTGWRVDLRIGLLWTVLGIVVGGGLAWLLGVREQFSGRNPPGIGVGLASLGVRVAAAVLFAFVFRRRLPEEPRPALTAVLVLLFTLLTCAPLAAAVLVDAPLLQTLLDLLWIGFAAGIGEEMFFRGYVQSRINQACGRPWNVLGVQFGVGLFTSALLFGFLHALNSVDYFAGRFTFAWGYGLMTVGLFSGVIRERTGRIWACAVMHILGNILGRAAALAAGVN